MVVADAGLRLRRGEISLRLEFLAVALPNLAMLVVVVLAALVVLQSVAHEDQKCVLLKAGVVVVTAAEAVT